MTNISFSDWWCNSENYWTNGSNIRVEKEEKVYIDKKERKVAILNEKVGLGKYPTLAVMQYSYNGKNVKTTKVKSIVYDAKTDLFLFEDYMIIGNRLNGSIYYYVDFNGIPVSDAYSNLTDEIYSKELFWESDKTYPDSEPWFYGYSTKKVQEILANELESRVTSGQVRVLKRKEERI